MAGWINSCIIIAKLQIRLWIEHTFVSTMKVNQFKNDCKYYYQWKIAISYFPFVSIIFEQQILDNTHKIKKTKEMKDKGKNPECFVVGFFHFTNFSFLFGIIFHSCVVFCFVLYEKRVESSCAFVIFYILSILPEPRVSLFQKHWMISLSLTLPLTHSMFLLFFPFEHKKKKLLVVGKKKSWMKNNNTEHNIM